MDINDKLQFTHDIDAEGESTLCGITGEGLTDEQLGMVKVSCPCGLCDPVTCPQCLALPMRCWFCPLCDYLNLWTFSTVCAACHHNRKESK
jgi:hypothetical protein